MCRLRGRRRRVGEFFVSMLEHDFCVFTRGDFCVFVFVYVCSTPFPPKYI